MTAKTGGKGWGSAMRQHKEESYRTGEKALTYEQVQRLLSQVSLPIQEEALLRLALDGGLRREDVVGVRAADVNPVEGQVMFYEHKKRRNWQVFLEPATMKALKQAMASASSVWLFPAVNPKKHIASRTAYNILQRNLKAIGVESKPFHALRSTCMKLKQKAGWPVEMTAKHTGDSIRVVQEHYLTPSLEEMREKVKATNLFGDTQTNGSNVPLKTNQGDEKANL